MIKADKVNRKLIIPVLIILNFSLLYSNEIVILLHGLRGSSKDMQRIEKSLKNDYDKIVNFSYPSTKHPVEILVEKYLVPAFSDFSADDTLHFVTHSMGGILLRVYLEKYSHPEIGKIVMIAPPNKGSEITDFFHKNIIYKKRYGEAGNQLTKDIQQNLSLSDSLYFDIGIIAGNKSHLPFFSCFIKGKDDGKYH